MTRQRLLNPLHLSLGLLLAAAASGCLEAPEVDQTQLAASVGGDVTEVPGCPGAWDYVTSFDGFVGTYGRLSLAPDGELTQVTIANVEQTPETIFVSGYYQRTVKSGLSYRQETGQYLALPINLLIGSGIVFKDLYADEIRDGYVLIGERRSPFSGRMAQLCLAKFDDNSDNGTAMPFVLYRWF